MISKVHEICTTPKKTHLQKKKEKNKENFGEVAAVVKLIPEQQEEQLRPLGLANEAKLF
jgi:DNA-binding transcriptional regulator PaaX